MPVNNIVYIELSTQVNAPVSTTTYIKQNVNNQCKKEDKYYPENKKNIKDERQKESKQYLRQEQQKTLFTF